MWIGSPKTSTTLISERVTLRNMVIQQSGMI